MRIRLVLISVILVIITSTITSADDCWSALARNTETHEIVIKTGPTRQAAVGLAKQTLGGEPNAIVWAWGFNSCLAIAVDTENDKIFGVGSGLTLEKAIEESLKICGSVRSSKKCEIKLTHCCR